MENRKIIITLTENGPEVDGADGIKLYEMISVGASLISGSIHQLDDEKEGEIMLEEIINLLRDKV